MPKFSQQSKSNLRTCDIRLQELFCEVIKVYDCTILKGHRDKTEQNRAYYTGRSKLKWPKGRHNRLPSLAADVAPYPIDWGGPLLRDGGLDKKNLEARLRFYHFAGYVQGIASSMGISLRWGGDWDGDFRFNDQTFNDLVHFELGE